MEIKKIGVLGAGIMGAGIAQVIAQKGVVVKLIDVDKKAVDKGLKDIDKLLQKSVNAGKSTEKEKNDVMNRISRGTDLNDFYDVDIVIEAIIENMAVKKEVYKTLDEVCPAYTILASNTSTLPISELGASTKRPDRVIGMHFFNPVPVMKLAEVIPGRVTSTETVDSIFELAKIMGKVPVKAKEAPGFLVNRILMPMLNEAAIAYQEGLATPEDIDTAMKLGANLPIGPLALLDMVGLDTFLAAQEALCDEFWDSKYRPATVLKQMVRAGHLGVKSGKGFYEYTR